MISVNTYMDGRVKSLGFQKGDDDFTVGVLLAGQYTFGTEKEEHLTVTTGPIQFLLPGGEWKTCEAGETIVIAAGVKFELKADSAAAYICEYK